MRNSVKHHLRIRDKLIKTCQRDILRLRAKKTHRAVQRDIDIARLENRIAELLQQKVRKCMTCKAEFLSSHVGNRLCDVHKFAFSSLTQQMDI